jgi:hypothetical protein
LNFISNLSLLKATTTFGYIVSVYAVLAAILLTGDSVSFESAKLRELSSALQ